AKKFETADIISPEHWRVKSLFGKTLGGAKKNAAPKTKQFFHPLRNKKKTGGGARHEPAEPIKRGIQAPQGRGHKPPNNPALSLVGHRFPLFCLGRRQQPR